MLYLIKPLVKSASVSIPLLGRLNERINKMPTFRVHREKFDTSLEAMDDGNVEEIQSVETTSGGNVWDIAHGILEHPEDVSLESTDGVTFVEPDFEQGFDYEPRQPDNALESLDVTYDETELIKQPRDTVSFPWLRLAGALEDMEGEPEGREAMFETEALRVFLQSPKMQQTVDEADPQRDDLERPVQRRLLETMRESKGISNALRGQLDEVIKRL